MGSSTLLKVVAPFAVRTSNFKEPVTAAGWGRFGKQAERTRRRVTDKKVRMILFIPVSLLISPHAELPQARLGKANPCE
jgi:hypothetical protein